MRRWLLWGSVALAVITASAAVTFLAVAALDGRRSPDVRYTDDFHPIEATGTVRAPSSFEVSRAIAPAPTIPGEGTPAVPGNATSAPSARTTPAVPSASKTTPKQPPASPTPAQPAVASYTGFWPDEVATFARDFDGAVWYPRHLPSGFTIDSLDVTKIQAGGGLVCDIVFTDGKKSLRYVQGSPETREQDVVRSGQIPWGNEAADIVYEDPTSRTTVRMLVYSKRGTLAEISGDAGFNELARVAASMVRVK